MKYPDSSGKSDNTTECKSHKQLLNSSFTQVSTNKTSAVIIILFYSQTGPLVFSSNEASKWVKLLDKCAFSHFRVTLNDSGPHTSLCYRPLSFSILIFQSFIDFSLKSHRSTSVSSDTTSPGSSVYLPLPPLNSPRCIFSSHWLLLSAQRLAPHSGSTY